MFSVLLVWNLSIFLHGGVGVAIFFFFFFFFFFMALFHWCRRIFPTLSMSKVEKNNNKNKKQTSWKGLFSSLTGRSGSPVLSDSLSLRNRTGEKRRRQTFCDKRENNYVWKNLPSTFLTFFSRSFCKRTENIDYKWRLRQNTHVIAPSLLSHTSVLPPSSSCHPVS